MIIQTSLSVLLSLRPRRFDMWYCHSRLSVSIFYLSFLFFFFELVVFQLYLV